MSKTLVALVTFTEPFNNMKYVLFSRSEATIWLANEGDDSV